MGHPRLIDVVYYGTSDQISIDIVSRKVHSILKAAIPPVNIKRGQSYFPEKVLESLLFTMVYSFQLVSFGHLHYGS